MLYHIDINKVLFLDIETVPICATYEELSDNLRTLWDIKSSQLATKNKSIGYKEEVTEKEKAIIGKEMFSRAGIYAEFGKIICISVGYFTGQREERQFRIKSFYSHSEKQLLSDFIQLLNTHYSNNNYLLCAHNGKEFDFPYLSRRILIHGLRLPALLDIAGKKPWEINHIDTMELWKFGDYKNYTSLNLLAILFNIPTPKNDIDGSDVARVYWEENNLERIVQYCQKDVTTIAQLLLRFKGESLLDEKNFIIV